MKKGVLLGVMRCLMALIWILCYPLIICPDEDVKFKFEPINEEKKVYKEYPPEEEFETEYESGYIARAIDIDYEDAQMLMKIAQAEAEIDGEEGMAMVMAVVLNRVEDKRFPDSIKGVIFQEKQFSPIADGRYYQAEPDVNCHLALAEIEKGNYKWVDALYFENSKGSWQQEECDYLYTVGHHRFYKN